jgi:hypothetical protein
MHALRNDHWNLHGIQTNWALRDFSISQIRQDIFRICVLVSVLGAICGEASYHVVDIHSSVAIRRQSPLVIRREDKARMEDCPPQSI